MLAKLGKISQDQLGKKGEGLKKNLFSTRASDWQSSVQHGLNRQEGGLSALKSHQGISASISFTCLFSFPNVNLFSSLLYLFPLRR